MPHRRSTRSALGRLSTLGASVLFVLSAATGIGEGSASGASHIERGSILASGPGLVQYCAHGTINATSGYYCARATVPGGRGMAEAWTGLRVGQSLSGVSGLRSVYVTGSLHLASSFLRTNITCSVASLANASADLFWSFSILDRTTHQPLGSGNTSGYLWRAHPMRGISCFNVPGRFGFSSPALTAAFNSSANASSTSPQFAFNATHRYLVTVTVGCLVEAQVIAVGSGAAAHSYCNIRGATRYNFVTIGPVAIV